MSSSVLAQALRGAERAARADTPLLILGEAGTGRTTLARALHDASTRTGALVEVDVATIPASLFESELFGYRAGAFSGADRNNAGRVTLARQGTLFLDHIEELPLETQPKLLRLLAEGAYAPLGGAEAHCDARVIAVASDQLPQRVQRGLFREDLYYRLDVISFQMPPLRQRKGDLAELVEVMLEELRQRYRRFDLVLEETALEWMEGYSWPGNLRQLRNLLERELLSGDSPTLSPGPPFDAMGERPKRLRDLELEEVKKALRYTKGHQGRAAALLGISRKSLWEKRKRFEIG